MVKQSIYALLISLFLLAACSTQQVKQYTLDVAAVSASMLAFDQSLSLAIPTIERNLGHYTTDEQNQLIEIRDRLLTIRGSLGMHLDRDNPTSIFIAYDQARVMYLQAEEAYITAKDLVKPRLHMMTAGEQQMLRNLDIHARRLSIHLERLFEMTQGDITASMIELLTLATLIAEIVQ
ncbi:MAG: hypothetical protein AB2604_10675 [Candidatus Thiodiazotropha taylori]